MDFHLLFLLIHSWILCTVSAAPSAPPVAPAAPAPSAAPDSPRLHVRTKRCSCASFLDKECVYFCHLDIIWVNTPERVVSYGLGNAPRTKRSISVTTETEDNPRCKCLQGDDITCRSFCRVENNRRVRRGSTKWAGPLKTHLLLEKWRARRRHRTWRWEGERAAS